MYTGWLEAYSKETSEGLAFYPSGNKSAGYLVGGHGRLTLRLIYGWPCWLVFFASLSASRFLPGYEIVKVLIIAAVFPLLQYFVLRLVVRRSARTAIPFTEDDMLRARNDLLAGRRTLEHGVMLGWCSMMVAILAIGVVIGVVVAPPDARLVVALAGSAICGPLALCVLSLHRARPPSGAGANQRQRFLD